MGANGLAPDAPAALNAGMTDASAKPVLLLVRDLMFMARVTGTARELGVPVKVVRDPAKLSGEAGAQGGRLIVDLNLEGAIEAAAEWKGATGGSVAGFVSHVDTETIRRAREAGIDRVMARSQFVQVLPELLSSPSPSTPGEGGGGGLGE
jgi:hypothetical protein